MVSPEGIVIKKSLRLDFSATNNEVEYEALLVGMTMVWKMGRRVVEVFSYSRLVGGQAGGELEARDLRVQEYLSQVILVEDLYKPAEVKKEGAQIPQIRVRPSWMDPIVIFLKDNIFPKEKGEADKVRRKASCFWLSEDEKLYKHSFSGPYLLCVHPEAIDPLLEELHEGIYGGHTWGRSLSHRALTQGYWWPGMQNGVQEYVRKCDQCQKFAPNIHQPEGVLNPLSSLWPFAQWGLDIVGTFPKVARNKKWLLVGTDYFTKWVKTEPLVNIRDMDAKRFVLRIDIQLRLIPKEMDRPRLSTGETPFSLTYGADAIIPRESGFPTLRTILFTPDSNNRFLEKSLDLIKERRENFMVQLVYYQQKLKQGYNSNVKLRPLATRDLILQKVLGTAKNPA
ncbi:uncharacterized protein LOC142644311 [Castanea sativa]|uniref:uncharacterized protein LOC142644311 n=1 Tax=Castanea sativa TaxID=21020 RepID=UPI003F6518D3